MRSKLYQFSTTDLLGRKRRESIIIPYISGLLYDAFNNHPDARPKSKITGKITRITRYCYYVCVLVIHVDVLSADNYAYRLSCVTQKQQIFDNFAAKSLKFSRLR